MKKLVLVSLVMACLPFLAMAQTNDDLYFIPKKKTEKKATTSAVTNRSSSSSATTVVVKDLDGNVRDVDEYNRRYTSRDNTFTVENDTLFVEEKPYNERGEWVNGFEGTKTDYEYAMRIVRFRNPRYAIPISSPLYWEVVYSLPTWDWNVFNDGLFAYVIPTSNNRMWWDWGFNYSWAWYSPWYYNNWYGGYWGGWYDPFWNPYHYHHYHPHHSHYPHYAWGGVGGYWGGGHGWNGSSARNPGKHAGRYANNYQNKPEVVNTTGRRVNSSANRSSRDGYVNDIRQNNTRNGNTVRNSSGRVVTAKEGSTNSVRPQRSAVRGRDNATMNNQESTGVRSNSVYTRPAQGKSSSYDRQSSTRSTVNNTGSGSSYQRRGGAAERGTYRNNSSSSRSSENRSTYNNSNHSSSRSNVSSGSSSSSRSSHSSSGGGSSRSSSGSSSRSGGGRR